MSSCSAPTTAGISANQRFTLAASTVPVTEKVPARKKGMRRFFRAVVLTHGAVSVVAVIVGCQFVGTAYPSGYTEKSNKCARIPLGVYRLFECPLPGLPKHRPMIT